MAEPTNFKGVNQIFGPPSGLDEMIGSLPVYRNGASVVSAWILDANDLAAALRGEPIFVSIMSGAAVFPMFVGNEKSCAQVVSDTGKSWIETKPETDKEIES